MSAINDRRRWGDLPRTVPAPRFLASVDDGRRVILAFECADGAELYQN